MHDAGLHLRLGIHRLDGFGKPRRPSMTAIRMSSNPRSFSSSETFGQNLAPPVCPTHRPGTSLRPTARMPRAWSSALLLAVPSSRIFRFKTSKYMIGYIDSSGLCCRTAPVRQLVNQLDGERAVIISVMEQSFQHSMTLFHTENMTGFRGNRFSPLPSGLFLWLCSFFL
jgi:hypothetical protein